MRISNPELKVIRFATDDVIASSALLGPLSGQTGLFYIPAGDFGGSYSGTGNYVQFNGTLGSYSGGAYEITGIYGATAGVDGDKANLDSIQHGQVYMADVGITLPATVFESIAQQTYDAFSYGNGKYYTNGTSYYESHWQ